MDETNGQKRDLGGHGFLFGCKYLLHDRDTKFCAAFDAILDAVSIKTLKLPTRSPNLNAHCERWIRSVKTEVLSKLILFGERSLRHCLENYVAHFHAERNHQGKDNVMLFPGSQDRIGESSGSIKTRERLGGLLKILLSRGRMSFLTLRAQMLNWKRWNDDEIYPTPKSRKT